MLTVPTLKGSLKQSQDAAARSALGRRGGKEGGGGGNFQSGSIDHPGDDQINHRDAGITTGSSGPVQTKVTVTFRIRLLVTLKGTHMTARAWIAGRRPNCFP